MENEIERICSCVSLFWMTMWSRFVWRRKNTTNGKWIVSSAVSVENSRGKMEFQMHGTRLWSTRINSPSAIHQHCKNNKNNMSMKTQIHGFLHTGQTTTSLERTTKTEEENLFSSITMLTDFGFISIWTEFFLHSEGMGTYTVMIDSYVHNRFKSTTFSSKWIDWRKESFVLWNLSRSENKYSHSICIVFQVLSAYRFVHRPISNLTLLWTVINALAFWTPQCSLLPAELAFKTHVKQRNWTNKQTNNDYTRVHIIENSEKIPTKIRNVPRLFKNQTTEMIFNVFR